MILVDTNVLLDVLEEDPRWAAWSQDRLDAAGATDALAINPIIYSELSMAFARIEELEAVIGDAALTVEAIPAKRSFWPARPSCVTGEVAAPKAACYLISISARTQP